MMQRSLISILFVITLLPLTGCIAIPATGEYSSGSRTSVEKKDVRWIKNGITTRDDVLLRFGSPDRIITAERIYVYRWATDWLIMGTKNSSSSAKNKHTLVITFDEKWVVKQHKADNSYFGNYPDEGDLK